MPGTSSHGSHPLCWQNWLNLCAAWVLFAAPHIVTPALPWRDKLVEQLVMLLAIGQCQPRARRPLKVAAKLLSVCDVGAGRRLQEPAVNRQLLTQGVLGTALGLS